MCQTQTIAGHHQHSVRTGNQTQNDIGGQPIRRRIIIHDLSVLHHKDSGTVASHVQSAVFSLKQGENLGIGQSILLRQHIYYLSVLHEKHTVRGACSNGTVRQLQRTSDPVAGDLRKSVLLVACVLSVLLQTYQTVLTIGRDPYASGGILHQGTHPTALQQFCQSALSLPTDPVDQHQSGIRAHHITAHIGNHRITDHFIDSVFREQILERRIGQT